MSAASPVAGETAINDTRIRELLEDRQRINSTLIPGIFKYCAIPLGVALFLPLSSYDASREDDLKHGPLPADTLVTYQKHIAPLLKQNCTPCHFPGGKVYEKYPFEDYATVFRVRKRLDTRLEKPEQKALLSRWIDSGTKEK